MTHCEQILMHIKKHGSITPLQALNLYGCYRLGARVYDLRRKGVKIRTNRVFTVNRKTPNKNTYYAKYTLD
ncbi:MAG: helix-turn-helix domain-containing protein [Clostridiales Family XIII bacterium]|nr:helix-turn-helix domain-containing protein [Clostridiales Family XIII bacterium]